MAIRIAVCEDEAPQAEYLEKLLVKWKKLSKKQAAVDLYQSAEEFLFETDGKQPYDLLLLDIQMGRMNGLELAKKIREQDERVKIVFLTGIADYAIEGYEVGAVRYLLKPIREADFFALLDKLALEIQQAGTDYFLFGTAGAMNRVLLKDILYVEADKHYVVLKSTRESKTLNGSRLSGEYGHPLEKPVENVALEWKWKANFSSVAEELLARGFFLLRRGLLVNIGRVTQIGKTECLLENGELLPVSKGKYQALNEAFIAYYKRRVE